MATNSILITQNPLRLLSKHFLYIHRPGEFTMQAGGRYACRSEAYGDMGIVEVAIMYEVPLHNLRPTVMLLADGDNQAIDRLKAAGMYSTDPLQICTCRFLSRKDAPFQQMFQRESRNIGLSIAHQSTLALS